MKTVERARQYPEVFLQSGVAAGLAGSGWQVREELSYLTKRFDIVAYRQGVIVCVEVKTREVHKALRQLTTSRLIFHKVFVAVAERYATPYALEACVRARCGLISVGRPPEFISRVQVPAPWCEERMSPHTLQLLRIAGFQA